MIDLLPITHDYSKNFSFVNGRTKEIGGLAYLFSLTEGLMRRESLDPKIEVLRQKKQYRQLIDLGDDLTRRGYMQALSPVQIAIDTDTAILRVTAGGLKEKSIEEQSMEEFELLCRQRKGEQEVFLRSGIQAIDNFVGGYALGELTVIGGRPQQGKSCMLAQVVIENAPKGIPCHIFSIEMRAGQFLRRLWAPLSGVPFRKLRNPRLLTDTDQRYIADAMSAVSQWPVVIDDSSGLSIGEFISRSRRSKRLNGTKLVGIDYLQKLTFSGKMGDRFQAVTDASVQFAKLAKDEGVAVLLLSSVTEKNGAHRNDPPTLQNLRMSGDIQFEASTVLLIHREIDETTEQVKEDGQIIVAKGRSDMTGARNIHFNGNNLLFE